MTKGSLKKRLRDLGAALRPLEREANEIAVGFADLLAELEERSRKRNRRQVKLTPAEIEKYDALDDLHSLVSTVLHNLEGSRESINEEFPPRSVRVRAGRAERKPKEAKGGYSNGVP